MSYDRSDSSVVQSQPDVVCDDRSTTAVDQAALLTRPHELPGTQDTASKHLPDDQMLLAGIGDMPKGDGPAKKGDAPEKKADDKKDVDPKLGEKTLKNALTIQDVDNSVGGKFVGLLNTARGQAVTDIQDARTKLGIPAPTANSALEKQNDKKMIEKFGLPKDSTHAGIEKAIDQKVREQLQIPADVKDADVKAYLTQRNFLDSIGLKPGATKEEQNAALKRKFGR